VFFLEGSRFIKEVLPADLAISDAKMAAFRLMVVGAALTTIPIFWPRGLWGRKEI